MKRFTAVFLVVLFLFLSGCKNSASEYLSDICGYFENLVYSLTGTEEIDKSEIVVIDPKDITNDYRQLSAYNRLTKNQKHLYNIMQSAVTDMQLKLINVTKYSSENLFSDVTVAQKALISDRPDIFWMPKAVSVVTPGAKGERYICFRDYDKKTDQIGYYGITKKQKQKMLSEIDEVTNEISAELNRIESAFDKELYIHDYLCKNIIYDDDSADNLEHADNDSLTIYGALVKGKAICEGYSKAMQYLCLKSGLNCTVVYGEADGSPHMWNAIDFGGEQYYLDVTFDDGSDDFTVHNYFNITKKQAEKEHKFYDEFSVHKSYSESDNFTFFCDDCENTTFNYYENKKAYIEKDCAKAVKAVLSAAQSGETKVELQNRTSMSPDDTVDLLALKLLGRKIIKKYYSYESNVIIVTW